MSEQKPTYADTYDLAFIENFSVDPSILPNLKYQSIPAWDSVGHMALMAWIEEAFDVMLEMDDVLDFSSYLEGKRILSKYGFDI